VAPEDLPTLAVGQRIKHYRLRAGKTRPVLGGLIGRSADWVKQIENGQLLPPRMPMLSRIAQALKVTVPDLLGDDTEQLAKLTGPTHAAMPAVRDALNRWPLVIDTQAQPLGHIEARQAMAWRARHAASDHRTVLGSLLPGLIRDAQLAARAYEGRQRRRANAILADVLGLTQMFVAYQSGAADLLWRIVDRALMAAHESGDIHSVAAATWFAMEAHRDTGDWDTAMAINLDVLRLVEPNIDDSDDMLGMYGALQTGAAFTSARAGEAGRAWKYLDEADRVAARLPKGYAHPWTWFSRPVVGFYAVSLGVELQRAGEAIRSARAVPPAAITSRPRRARHLIEVARGHHLRNAHAEAMNLLRQAYDSAPETIRYNGYAREITMGLMEGPRDLRPAARDLATKVGLLS
jgi:transcriptional regulator with XRE-family HTH domain